MTVFRPDHTIAWGGRIRHPGSYATWHWFAKGQALLVQTFTLLKLAYYLILRCANDTRPSTRSALDISCECAVMLLSDAVVTHCAVRWSSIEKPSDMMVNGHLVIRRWSHIRPVLRARAQKRPPTPLRTISAICHVRHGRIQQYDGCSQVPKTGTGTGLLVPAPGAHGYQRLEAERQHFGPLTCLTAFNMP
jgi:hypothetical protein